EVVVSHMDGTVTMTHRTPNPHEMVNFGRLTIEPDESVCYLFEASGSNRFSDPWQVMAEGALGAVVVVDSTAPGTFREVRQYVQWFGQFADVVVAANRQDQPGAVPPADMQILLGVDVPVLPCIAYNRASVKNVLLAVCHHALRYIERR
ncbi:MAG: GTP-binding protein, partial [Chloroflexota bacterium]